MRLIDADALRHEIHISYSDDLGILDYIDNAPTIIPKEFEPLLEAIMDALPAIVEKTVPAIVEKIERPTGEWIFDGEWRCSTCGQTPWYNKNPMESGYKFCPYCGAKMKGKEE